MNSVRTSNCNSYPDFYNVNVMLHSKIQDLEILQPACCKMHMLAPGSAEEGLSFLLLQHPTYP